MVDPLGTSTFGKAKIPNTYIVIVFVLLIFTGGLGLGVKMRAQNAVQDAADFIAGEDMPDGVDGENFIGGITMSLDEVDRWDNAAASPTSPLFNIYDSSPIIGAFGKPLAAGGDTLAVTGSGYMWIDVYGGTDYYLLPDYNMMKANNPRLTQMVINDWDVDGKLDYLVQFDVSDVGVTGQGIAPQLDMYLPLLKTDISTPAFDNPDDQTSIGSSETVIELIHTLSGVSEHEGYYISELWYTTNSTYEGDDVEFESISFGGGYDVYKVSGTSLIEITNVNEPVKKENGDYGAWYVEAVDDNDPLARGGLLVVRPTDAADTFTLTVKIRCTLTADVTVTAHMKYVSPAGAKLAITDAVDLDV